MQITSKKFNLKLKIMKKFLLLFTFVLCAVTSNAQFSLGAGVGIPTGDMEELSSFQMNINATYMFESESDFRLGLSASYHNYFGKTIEILGIEADLDDFAWLPLSAVLNYSLSDNVSIGTDVGYAIGMSPEDIEGGFYLRPNLVYSLGEKTSLNLSYTNMSNDGDNISNIGLGIAFQL